MTVQLAQCSARFLFLSRPSVDAVCLSVCLSVSPSPPLSVNPSILLCVYVYLSVCLSACLSVSPHLPLSLNPSILPCLHVYLSVCLSVCFSVCIPVCLPHPNLSLLIPLSSLFIRLSPCLSLCLSAFHFLSI